MKTNIKGFFAAVLCLTLASAQAQPGRPGGMGGARSNGPRISAAMEKLFGENTAFSADLENEMQLSKGSTVTMPGKISFDSGKARFDMNMSEAKGSAMPPQMIAQMKSMGMDTMTSINRPDLKVSYIVYPGLKAYAEMPIQDSDAGKSKESFKVETTEQGKETLDGHPTVKNKVIVTDDQGTNHEYTVWNATDLKKFPLKIVTAEEGMNMTMSFKNVKLDKPKADFNAPSDYKKYDNIMSLMQQEMMKKMQENGGGMGMPPNHP